MLVRWVFYDGIGVVLGWLDLVGLDCVVGMNSIK